MDSRQIETSAGNETGRSLAKLGAHDYWEDALNLRATLCSTLRTTILEGIENGQEIRSLQMGSMKGKMGNLHLKDDGVGDAIRHAKFA